MRAWAGGLILAFLALTGCGDKPTRSSGGRALEASILYDQLSELRDGLRSEQEARNRMMPGDPSIPAADESIAWTLRKMREIQAAIDAAGS